MTKPNLPKPTSKRRTPPEFYAPNNTALFLPSSRPLKPSTPRPASTVSNRRTTP